MNLPAFRTSPGGDPDNLDEVVAFATHDLRQPLMAAMTLLACIKRGGGVTRDTALLEDALGDLRQQIDDLDALVGNLPDAANAHPLDLRALVRTVSEPMAPAFDAAGIQLRVVQPAAPVLARGIAALTKRIVRNLLENVLRHAHGATWAWVELSTDGQVARLTVRDDGCGWGPSTRLPRRPGGRGLRYCEWAAGRMQAELRSQPVSVGVEISLDLPAS